MRIVLDAMGGDHAPKEIVAGAVTALSTYPDIELVLVGKEEKINEELVSLEYDPSRLEILDAREVITMNEKPTRALKKKKDSSIVKGLSLLKAKEADAFVSAGSTGAVMAASLFLLGRLPGIKRPSILINFPSAKGRTIVMDNGANIDSKPEHLLQFAIMGQLYAEKVLGISEPRTGLLSIGEEEEKGNHLTKSAFKLFQQEPRLKNFIGNVEGRDIFNGSCDLVICDGFIGNVVLKTTEGVASFIFKLLKDALMSNWLTKLAALVLKPSLKKMQAKVDYRQYGGAPLLGVDGVVIISHGSSDALAIKNAIAVARETVSGGVVELITKEINKDGEIDEI